MFVGLTLLLLPGAIIATVVWLIRIQRGRKLLLSTTAPLVTDPHSARVAQQHASRGAALALIVELGVLLLTLLMAGSQLAVPWDRGLGVGLSPVIAGILFLIVHLVTEVTAPRPAGSTRTAQLVRRTPGVVAPRFLRWWVWALTGVITVITVLFGLTAEPDGVTVGYHLTDHSGSAGVYPGWPYGIPILIGSLIVLAGIEGVIRLITHRSAISAVTSAWDLALRRLSAHRMLRGAQLPLALTAAGLLFIGGGTLRGLAGAQTPPVPAAAIPLYGWGPVFMWAAAVIVVTAIVIACIPGTAPAR